MEHTDITSESDVIKLVDTFYAKVLRDEEIGFIFTDVAQLSLDKHMPIMYNFWNSILLGKSGYKGNPIDKHQALHSKVTLTEAHFKRWLSLWEATVNENFVGNIAEEAKTKALSIATLMQIKLSQ